MRIMISPAKKMRQDDDSFLSDHLPDFLEQTETLKAALQAMTPEQLQALWKCSDTLTRQNVRRLETMDLYHRLTPAVMAYEGIQYQYLAPDVLETEALNYVKAHLRIVSGFYGLLRPFDGVTPYRLEFQARLPVGGCRDLYQFWGTRLADALAAETSCVVDLASREYSKAVKPHLPQTVRFITCTFGERKGEKIIEKGTACKMARGQMVRWMAEHDVQAPEQLKEFTELGYQYSPSDSQENQYVFVKGGA